MLDVLFAHALEALSRLAPGWDGYDAPPPSGAAIAAAKRFLPHALQRQCLPKRISPLAVGGVSIVFHTPELMVVVEFHNDESAYAGFLGGSSDPIGVKEVVTTPQGFDELLSSIVEYMSSTSK